MTPSQFLQQHKDMDPQTQLEQMVRVLTGPEGCPWDQKQTAATIVDYVIDEAHELKQSILSDDAEEIEGELGDFLFTVEFLKERLSSKATLAGAGERLVEKMIRRHPHVFSDSEFRNEAELKRNWEAEKRKEARSRARLDEDLPASLPPMKRAVKVLSRAMNAGFRYLRVEDAFDKVSEEFFELEQALYQDQNFEEEFGDLMLSLLTPAKMKNCSPDNALQQDVAKLCDRLQRLEQMAGKSLEEIPHAELGSLYQQAKQVQREQGVFLNFCGVSPWPRSTRNAVRRVTHRLGREGLPVALELLERREALKPTIRDFCGAPENSTVSLLPNVSNAALGVAYAQDWVRGDKVLLGRGEFPANTVPWKVAAEAFGVEPLWFDDDRWRTAPEVAWQELEELLGRERPRLMAVSAVSFWSGYRVALSRLGELCRRYGTRLYVDAIQALGNTPTLWCDGVDYLAGGSHKALLAPEAAGFLLVSGEAGRDWKPRMASWLSLPDPVHFLTSGQAGSVPNHLDPRGEDPTVLQGSSLNSVGYVGLEASLQFLRERSPARIFEQVQHLHDLLEPGLAEIGWESLRARKSANRSAILSFLPPPETDLVLLQGKLAERGISCGIPNGVLRFGFHYSSTERDVQRVIAAMRDI